MKNPIIESLYKGYIENTQRLVEEKVSPGQEVELFVHELGIGLPDILDVMTLPKNIRAASDSYWLCSPTYPGEVMFVYDNGDIERTGDEVTFTFGVRPTLTFKTKLDMFDMYDKFSLAGHNWTKISSDTALCDDVIGESPYSKSGDTDIENSDILRWLLDWCHKNDIWDDSTITVRKL